MVLSSDTITPPATPQHPGGTHDPQPVPSCRHEIRRCSLKIHETLSEGEAGQNYFKKPCVTFSSVGMTPMYQNTFSIFKKYSRMSKPGCWWKSQHSGSCPEKENSAQNTSVLIPLALFQSQRLTVNHLLLHYSTPTGVLQGNYSFHQERG